MLNVPTTECDIDEELNIFDDLKKLVNSKKFLEIKNLDLATFAINPDIVSLLIESIYIANL